MSVAAEAHGLIARYRAGVLAMQRSAAQSTEAEVVPEQKLALVSVSYEGAAARSPLDNRVTRVVAQDLASAEISVARIDYWATSAVLTVSTGPSEANQIRRLEISVDHPDSRRAMATFRYMDHPDHDFAISITGQTRADSAEATIRVAGEEFHLALKRGSLPEEAIAPLIEMGERRQAPELLDAGLVLPLVSSEMNRWPAGGSPPVVPEFWKCLLIELGADAVCGIVCGVIAGVLCHEGSAR